MKSVFVAAVMILSTLQAFAAADDRLAFVSGHEVVKRYIEQADVVSVKGMMLTSQIPGVSIFTLFTDSRVQGQIKACETKFMLRETSDTPTVTEMFTDCP